MVGYVEGASDAAAPGGPPPQPRMRTGALGSAHLEGPRARCAARVAGEVTRRAATAGARGCPDACWRAQLFSPLLRCVGAASARACAVRVAGAGEGEAGRGTSLGARHRPSLILASPHGSSLPLACRTWPSLLLLLHRPRAGHSPPRPGQGRLGVV